MSRRKQSLFDPRIVRQAAIDSFRKLHPRRMVRNPVMFVVYVGSFLTTGLAVPSARPPNRATQLRWLQASDAPMPRCAFHVWMASTSRGVNSPLSFPE